MKLSPNSKIFSLAVILLPLAGIVGFAFKATLSAEMADYLLPTLATFIIFVLFSAGLKWKVGDNLFGDLGFLYLGLAVAYTIFPVLAFMFGSSSSGDQLMLMLPAPSDLSIHLWRHVLFIFAIATGYLLVRGREIPHLITVKDSKGKDGSTIVYLIGITIFCILVIMFSSAPVSSYYDHYTRYDHLPWLARKFVSVCLRLKLGMYTILLTFLFLNYKKYRLTIIVIVIIICLHEMIYSFGSRIETLIILLEVTCLYNYTVKTISLKKGLLACLGLVLLFSVVELLRTAQFDLSSVQNKVSNEGFKSASEFGAVYFPGFHLYAERAQGTLPKTEWPMFFNEFISIFTFGDFSRWNPMVWYAQNFYPESIVPPFTLGPIAESAIWGGEVDLLLRGLINGAFFAFIVRWFIRHKNKWWGVTIYVYCYATCILTIKYAVFWHLTPLFKTILPTMLVVGVVRKLIPSKQKYTNVGSYAIPQ